MFAESLASLLSDQADLEVVAIASTADAAITLSHQLHPDVVVVDYELPDGDGTTVAARIRATNTSIQVVMLSAHDGRRTVLAAVEAGCGAFLTRDMAVSELVAAIRATAAGEPHFSPSAVACLLRRSSYRGVGTELTARENQVLDMLAQAKSNQAIADQFHLTVNTVRNHVSSILLKLGAHSKLEAVTIANREGLVRI